MNWYVVRQPVLVKPDDWFYNFCGNVGAVSAQHLIVERIFNLAMEFSTATLFAPARARNFGLCPIIAASSHSRNHPLKPGGVAKFS
jgi:hypothetical protein